MTNRLRQAFNARDRVQLGRLLRRIAEYEASRPREQLNLFNTQRGSDIPNSKRRNRRLAG